MKLWVANRLRHFALEGFHMEKVIWLASRKWLYTPFSDLSPLAKPVRRDSTLLRGALPSRLHAVTPAQPAKAEKSS